jgi:putative membrane protein
MSLSKKLQNDIESTSASKLLVICVDRDDDIGKKAGIKSPVVGRDACLEAAQRLALEDPEDDDSNAIFGAVKTYEDLISKGYTAEVVTVAGDQNRGVQADEKVVTEIKLVLKTFSANGAVIVSDGDDDEMVIPVIQNVIPVVSVQRVVMQVSKTIEHSYAVFGKFLKMVMYDPKYSKFFLGVPGILLLIGGVGTITGLTAEISAVLVSILGAAFLIRAFDLDKAWSNWAKPTPTGFIRIFTLVTGIILILASVPAGLNVIDANIIAQELEIFQVLTNQQLIGQFLGGMLPILWIGIGTIFAGILTSNWVNGKLKHISDIIRLIALASIYPTVAQFATMLVTDADAFSLIPPLLIGGAITLISATLLFRRYRKKGGQVLTE